MRIGNITRGTKLASPARMARAYWPRLVGLLGHSSLQPGEALVLEPSSSVHTFFMRFPIGIVYLDRSRRVVKGGCCAAALPDRRRGPEVLVPPSSFRVAPSLPRALLWATSWHSRLKDFAGV